MAVFIEKPPVTSSKCYETMKNALIFLTRGTNVNWTISSVTACSSINFLLPWKREGGRLKIAKKNPTKLHCFVFITTFFKVLQLLNELRWSKKLFSAGY
jgi:hypothetical protein